MELFECLLPKDWEEIKKFPAIVARKHVNGNITFVSVLVDLLCTGAKDVMFFVNEPEFLYREILERYEGELLLEFLPVSYELVHNVIFESVAFAEEYGIAPHEDFRYVELVLEADSDDFPRIDIPLGEGGKAQLYLNEEDERAAYFERQILRYGQPGTYEVIRDDSDPFLDDFEEDEEEDWDEDWDEDDYIDSCFDWDELDWEDFYDEGDFGELGSDIVDFTIPRLPGYSYIAMIEEPLFSPFMEVEVTDSPTSKYLFGKAEIKTMEGVFAKLEEADLEPGAPDLELLEGIEKGILAYPDNRVIHQYKWEYFSRTGDLEKAMEVALEMKEKFPGYLYGLACHAQTLIEMGDVDGIPEAMGDFTKIQDCLPDRTEFHPAELQSFYSPWIYYYAKTGQLRAAFFLVSFLEDHLILFEYPLHELVNAAYLEEAAKPVKAYFAEVESGKVSKEEFLDLMLSEPD